MPSMFLRLTNKNHIIQTSQYIYKNVHVSASPFGYIRFPFKYQVRENL